LHVVSRGHSVDVSAPEAEERAAFGQPDPGALAALGAAFELIAVKPLMQVEFTHVRRDATDIVRLKALQIQ
jgi:hypothetical protein